MPVQPLLPARRPRADSSADPGVAVEAPADVVPVAPPTEVPVQAGLPVSAAEAPSEGAVAPASKKARQYDLPPQQPIQPMPQLQPQRPASSSSPAALDDSTLPEPEAKKHKKQEEDDDELAVDCSHPLQPTDPPVLPLSEHQPAAAPDLDASRSRSRTHSEVSEVPTIEFPIKIRHMIRHVRLDKRKLLFPNYLLRHQIRPHGLLPWRQQSSTPTLPRHMDEYMLN